MNQTLRFLSYPLRDRLPVYGARGCLEIRPVKSMAKGDSCNVYRIKMENHWGTHVDAPAHFFERAKKVTDYQADYWKFKAPQVVSVKLGSGQLLSIEAVKGIDPKADLVLFKSGWGKRRLQKSYSVSSPGILPDVGLWLRKKYPRLRAIGLDWISISSYQHRELGRAAHRAFLNPKAAGRPILIFEDMDLSANLNGLSAVLALPLRIQGIDSAPCTVIGEWN